MGATNIEFSFEGKKTQSEIKEAFKERQEIDKVRNGHQDGYSGDFQTVSGIDFRHLALSNVFQSYDKAHDFCLKNSEKWSDLIAVYYINKKEIKTPNTVERLTVKIKALQAKVKELQTLTVKSAFISCGECKSRLKAEHLRCEICPLCRTSLLSKTTQERIKKAQEQVKVLEEKIAAIIKEVANKVLNKKGEKAVSTLIAGWAAC